MNLIEADSSAFLAADDAQAWRALQTAITVLKMTERLPELLTVVDGTLGELISEHGSKIFEPLTLAAARASPQTRYLLTDQRRMAALERLVAKAKGRDFVALVRGPSLLQGLKMKAEELMVDSALVHVKRLLADVPRMRLWSDKTQTASHLPSFSSSPLPYVTQVSSSSYDIHV